MTIKSECFSIYLCWSHLNLFVSHWSNHHSELVLSDIFFGFFPHRTFVFVVGWYLNFYTIVTLWLSNAYLIQCCVFSFYSQSLFVSLLSFAPFSNSLVIQKQYITAFYIVTGNHHHMTLVIWKMKAFHTNETHTCCCRHQAKLHFNGFLVFESFVWNVKRRPQHIFNGISTRLLWNKWKKWTDCSVWLLSWLYGYVFEVLIIIVKMRIPEDSYYDKVEWKTAHTQNPTQFTFEMIHITVNNNCHWQ